MRTLLAITTLVVACVLVGCSGDQPSASAEDEGGLPTLTRDLPDPEIGVTYDYNVLTHCSFWGLTIDGDPWFPVGGPPVERQDGNFDFNTDQGTVVLTDDNHAVYTSSTGFEVEVDRWTGSSVPPGWMPHPCM